jgi:hypothetical protein
MGRGEVIDADLALAFIALLKELLRVVTSEHNKHGELSRKATEQGLKPHRVRAPSTNKKMFGCEEKTCYPLRQTRSYGWAEA